MHTSLQRVRLPMIGVDIGGQLKVVDEARAHIHYCPLWKGTPIRDITGLFIGR